jgi:hypothetical protein
MCGKYQTCVSLHIKSSNQLKTRCCILHFIYPEQVTMAFYSYNPLDSSACSSELHPSHSCNFAARSIAISHMAYVSKLISIQLQMTRQCRKTYLNRLFPLSIQIPPLDPLPHILHNNRSFASVYKYPISITRQQQHSLASETIE